MSEQQGATPGGTKEGSAPGGMSRRELLRWGGATLGSAAVGAFIGYQAGPSSKGDKGTATGERVWKVGAVVPKKQPYAGEGQETARGLDLGLKVLNGRGGLGGRPVELVTAEVADLSEASLVAAAKNLVGQEVVAVFLGFTSPTCAEFATYAEYGAPVFHLSTSAASLAASTEATPNIFRCVPAPAAYGPAFANLLKGLGASGAYAPGNRSVGVVVSDDADGDALAASVASALGGIGWSVAVDERVALPVADWTPTLAQLAQSGAGAVFLGVPTAPDLAAFQKAFAAAPFPSLIYATFGPSVPEYLALAGQTADGVIWSTPVGTIADDAASTAYQKLYAKKYGKSGFGLGQAGANYDLLLFWAQCAASAKRPSKFSAVLKAVPQVLYRGVSGVFNLSGADRVAVGYPADTKDPSLGLPHLTFQIQGSKQVRLAPAPYVSGEFKRPSWL